MILYKLFIFQLHRNLKYLSIKILQYLIIIRQIFKDIHKIINYPKNNSRTKNIISQTDGTRKN